MIQTRPSATKVPNFHLHLRPVENCHSKVRIFNITDRETYLKHMSVNFII